MRVVGIEHLVSALNIAIAIPQLVILEHLVRVLLTLLCHKFSLIRKTFLFIFFYIPAFLVVDLLLHLIVELRSLEAGGCISNGLQLLGERGSGLLLVVVEGSCGGIELVLYFWDASVLGL